jgi:hypothetical protein
MSRMLELLSRRHDIEILLREESFPHVLRNKCMYELQKLDEELAILLGLDSEQRPGDSAPKALR